MKRAATRGATGSQLDAFLTKVIAAEDDHRA
jgi:prophage regulatory protein